MDCLIALEDVTRIRGVGVNYKIWIKKSLLLPSLLDIICILKRDEKHHSYKIIGIGMLFSLIAKFRAKRA